MNVDSATCWRRLSCQGQTGNGIATCLNLVIVQEAIQSRFRCGVVATTDPTFLSTLLRSKLVVDTVEVATHSKGSISPNSPLNPINSLERDPRLDVDCCGHHVELSTTPNTNPPPLTIRRTYQQLFLAVTFPIDGSEQLIDLFLFDNWYQLSLPHGRNPHGNWLLVFVRQSYRRSLIRGRR